MREQERNKALDALYKRYFKLSASLNWRLIFQGYGADDEKVQELARLTEEARLDYEREAVNAPKCYARKSLMSVYWWHPELQNESASDDAEALTQNSPAYTGIRQ